MKKYLFFRSEVDEDNVGGVGATTGGGSCLMIAADKLTGMSPTSDVNLRLTFESIKNGAGAGDYGQVVTDYVDLTVGAHTHKVVMDAILDGINGNPHNDGFIVIADDVVTFTDNTTRTVGEYIHGDISACTVTLAAAHGTAQARTFAGASGGTTVWHSYGAGAISTEVAPTYAQHVVGEDIITTIKVDLTALGCQGDAANDVIGLPAGGAAYIGKYIAADMGAVIYKAEVDVLEVPGEGTATITTDIDVAFNASATKIYDNPNGGAGEANFGGLGNLGTASANLTSHPTNNDYIYLVEGDAGATTGVYNAGKLVIKLYGRASF